MFWEILKIEPTTDKQVIRVAYRELLSLTNPEEKPEEFKALREAYEAALAYAEEHASDKVRTPIEIWQDELEEVYGDFSRRCELTEWQKLLNQDICLSVDTRMECEDRLLRFLMEHYFLSHEVWVYFDQQFSWLDRQTELYETYPRDFIDYVVINGIHFSDILPMKMFMPGRDAEACSEYLNLYHKLMNVDEPEEARATAEKMMTLSEQHPYGTVRMLLMRIEDNDEEALTELIQLQKQYPDDMFIGLMLVEYLFESGRHEECRTLIEELKKYDRDNLRLRWFEAGCLAETGDYQEAVKIIDGLLRDTAGNGQMQYDLNQKRMEWNKILIDRLSAKLETEPDNIEDRVNLAWAYLENDYLDQAAELAAGIPEDYEDRFGYYNLNGSIALAQMRYADAAEYLEELVRVAENLPADSEKNVIRRGRVGEMCTRLGYCYHCMNETEKAEQAYGKALQVSENRTEILNHLSEISLSSRDFEKAAEYSRQLIREFPGGYQGYLMLAFACFYMHQDREAYNAVERALDLCRSDLTVYTLKARILIRNGAADGAREIVDFLLENGLENDPTVLFTQGVLKEDADQDVKTAEELFEKALAGMNGLEMNYEYGAEMLYRLLYLKGDHLDGNRKEDRDIMNDLVDRGLKCNPDHYGLKDYKAWLLIKEEEYEEALKIYLELMENPHHGPSVEAWIGYIYYQDLEHSADRSLQYYEKSLAEGGSASGHFYAGMCCMYMHRLDDAEEHFKALEEKNPASVDGPYRLSYVYHMKGELDKALAASERAIEVVKDRSGSQTQYYVRKAILLRRMKRYDEAIAVIREAMERYGYEYGNRMIFMIYAQAGRLKEAEEHLRQWTEAGKPDSELYDCGILLHMYRRDFEGALLEKKTAGEYLHPDRALEVDQIISEYYGDYKKQLKQTLKWLQYRLDRDGFDISRIQGTLAHCYFRLGDYENARHYASEALKEVDRKLAEFETDKLLFMARRIRLLAILGRREEAYEAIEQCRHLPFCQSCPESTCKDTDIFRMEAEEIFGNYDKAYEIACECQSLYPNEEDFLIAEHNLKRKLK